jgi:hypothetical protein
VATEDSSSSSKTYLDAMTAMSAAMHQHTMQAMNRAEEAVAEILDACAQNAQSIHRLSPPPETVEQLMKPSEIIDRGYDLAEQLLKAQHTLARTLLGTVEQHLAETAGAASSKPATETASSGNDAADNPHATDPAAEASETDTTPDDSDNSGGLGQAIKNAFRGSPRDETGS